MESVDFDRSPFLVIWEVTQACDLACVHCRAEARPWRDPRELSTAEGFALLEEISRFGSPLVVLTGGDPIFRADIFDLIARGSGLGLRMTMTPSGTSRTTADHVRMAKAAGLARMAVSLDGATAGAHDRFRGVAGSFCWTMDILRACREEGLPVQVNTSVTRQTADGLDAIADLVAEIGAVLWSVFFLVPTGRGRKEDEVNAREYERIFHRLYDIHLGARFDVKTTAAPHYRRVMLERAANGGAGPRPLGFSGGIGRAAAGVNDGKGFVFVSHVGEIYPSGFLPVSAGNVRRDSLVQVYREAPLFRALRDPSLLKGKCGRCEYREVCGGSRARAYAVTGDYLAADPYCAYQPPSPASPPDEGRGAPSGMGGAPSGEAASSRPAGSPRRWAPRGIGTHRLRASAMPVGAQRHWPGTRRWVPGAQPLGPR